MRVRPGGVAVIAASALGLAGCGSAAPAARPAGTVISASSVEATIAADCLVAKLAWEEQVRPVPVSTPEALDRVEWLRAKAASSYPAAQELQGVATMNRADAVFAWSMFCLFNGHDWRPPAQIPVDDDRPPEDEPPDSFEPQDPGDGNTAP